ncbi:phenylacetate--CoA ligase family protein [Thiolapillus sp.]
MPTLYSWLFQRILEPVWEERVRRRSTLRHERFLNDSQWLPKEQILEYQWSELKRLLDHANHECSYWKKVFAELGLSPGDIDNLEQFRRLPITTKTTIRENYDDMIARSWKGKTWRKSTGGSTGEPLHFEYTPESSEWRQATTRRGYAWAGARSGIRQAYIWGISLEKEPLFKRAKQALHHLLLRHKYFNSFNCDHQAMQRCRKKLQRFKPEVIIGYTNPLYRFSRFLNSRKKHAGIHPASVITAAEALFEHQRGEIESAFDAPVFHSYGSREFMLIAMECEHHEGLHISAENLLVEILREDGSPAAPGEEGRVVITDLHNYGMPFIRYEIGDMAVLAEQPCSCGRGLPLLKQVTGRILDMISTPDGRQIPGEYFPHLMKDFRNIQHFQVIQNNRDSLIIKLVAPEGLPDSELDKLKAHVRKIMGEECRITYDLVDEIPLTRTGKHRVTISRLNS